MPTYIALLRGINVGKAKRVPMAELRAMLAELGYAKVATLLNSGNVVFQAARRTPDKLAAEISNAIASRLEFEVPVIVKTAKEFEAITTDNASVSTEEPLVVDTRASGGSAITITMMKGMIVQTTSTVTDSWKLAALWPTDLRCFQME